MTSYRAIREFMRLDDRERKLLEELKNIKIKKKGLSYMVYGMIGKEFKYRGYRYTFYVKKSNLNNGYKFVIEKII